MKELRRRAVRTALRRRVRRECCPVCEVGAVKLGQRDALTNDCATITSTGFHEATSLLDAERMREDRDISNYWEREEGSKHDLQARWQIIHCCISFQHEFIKPILPSRLI